VHHLRWANAHTAWFSSLLVDTFETAAEDSQREAITRVLLERLLAARPYPFGLLYTFKNILSLTKHRLVDQPFVRQSAEISVMLKSCQVAV